MIHTNRKRLCGGAILSGLSVALVVASGQSIRAAGADAADGRLAGAWTVQVTLRNCDTNAPTGAFSSLVTFHQGGTLSESTGSVANPPGQRSEGHGAWKPIGFRTYSQRVIGLIRFDSPPNLPGTPTFDPSQPISPGFQAGWQTISHRVRLTGPDSFESAGTTAFFTSAGAQYRAGCSTAVGNRFE
jgi:hypothetical protein